jgi:hypothetical protein
MEFLMRPNCRLVVHQCSMTVIARVPFTAAFEFDSDDVERRVPMRAAGFGVDIDAVDECLV